MANQSFKTETFDRRNPLSIYEYSRHLIGHSLHSLLGKDVIEHKRKGKGGLGQMVEELFFNYAVNSNREADFAKANVELKCTPLLKMQSEAGYRIKERLVCTMIDYFEIVNTTFEESHLLAKCRLMLLLFYLHVKGKAIYDYEFLFRILWQLPEKDLLLIKKDYETIAEKVRSGNAHLLSEGDTIYLGACRKGQKEDTPQSQPNSEHKAKKRAFSLKPAYMRYVLSHVIESGENHFTNYVAKAEPKFELVKASELADNTFEQIVVSRFAPFIGKNYKEICEKLGVEAIQSKNEYADVCSLIASDGKSRRINQSEEFVKSGLTMKTIRLQSNGMPKESMSFKNIDYCEVYENDDWLESDLYEIFTSRFMFVVFKPVVGSTIKVVNRRKNKTVEEREYKLDSVFFWTMPAVDLETAEEYWRNIRQAVVENKIEPESFWSIKDHKKFHVRPKAQVKADKAVNPSGGYCDKYCYWLNADYVKTIIEEHSKK